MTNARKLTEGALFLAIFAVLLLITLYLPVLGMITNLFLALPFIMFSARNDRKGSFVFLIGAILISLIIGSVVAIPLALSYGLTGIVLGDFIRENKSRVAGFIAGSIVFLISLVVEYAVAILVFEVDFIKESIGLFQESLEQSTSMLESIGQSPDPVVLQQFETSIKMLEVLVPSLFAIASFMLAFFIQLVSLPIVKRFGIVISKWQPFRELKLPKSILWYYIIVLVVSLIFNPEEGNYWYTALLNLSFILQLLLLLQGLSFIYFISYEKEFPKFIPIFVTILMLFIPILLYIVRILGIIDLGFDLRKRVERKSE